MNNFFSVVVQKRFGQEVANQRIMLSELGLSLTVCCVYLRSQKKPFTTTTALTKKPDLDENVEFSSEEDGGNSGSSIRGSKSSGSSSSG